MHKKTAFFKSLYRHHTTQGSQMASFFALYFVILVRFRIFRKMLSPFCRHFLIKKWAELHRPKRKNYIILAISFFVFASIFINLIIQALHIHNVVTRQLVQDKLLNHLHRHVALCLNHINLLLQLDKRCIDLLADKVIPRPECNNKS